MAVGKPGSPPPSLEGKVRVDGCWTKVQVLLLLVRVQQRVEGSPATGTLGIWDTCEEEQLPPQDSLLMYEKAAGAPEDGRVHWAGL